jgi:hypothetical protein
LRRDIWDLLLSHHAPPYTEFLTLPLDRLRLRGPNGARDEFHLAAAAQNLRKLAKLIPMPTPRPA